MSLFRKIANSKLYISEPNASWFGNPVNERGNKLWTNENWLKSRFHFSFAEYNNNKNQNFGVLRVLNDDLVQPDRGFGEHPHRDVEICTYVVEGNLTHQDSMGTKETLSRGSIQFMTAGKGVEHSEHNLDKLNPLRFLQLWITTRQRGLTPNYGSYSGDFETRHNKWAHLVSDVKSNHDTPIQINSDANIHVTELDSDSEVTFTIEQKRQVYLICIEGNVVITGNHNTEETLERHDAAELFGPNTFTVKALNDKESSVNESIESKSNHNSRAHLLLVEMSFEGSGRLDL